MNTIIDSLFGRKSVRVFQEKAISFAEKDIILESAIQAPTAGNQILYTILDIEDQHLKNALAVSCDNQPFIAQASMVLVFLADCRRWMDCYHYAAVTHREPGIGDMFLACEDALIAAQNAVVAAESLGIGSCYIGDILENGESVTKIPKLDAFTLPITMVVFGYPTEQQKNRQKPKRFNKKYIVQKNTYTRLSEKELRAMFQEIHPEESFDFKEYITAFCQRKYMSEFAQEMNRSAERYVLNFMKDNS